MRSFWPGRPQSNNNNSNKTMDDLQQMRLTSSSCAKVFIQRDYSEGVGVKFDTKLPAELQGKIDPAEFEQVIERINGIYADAERLSARTCFENCCACLTAYLLLACMPTSYEKVSGTNKKIYAKKIKFLISKKYFKQECQKGVWSNHIWERPFVCTQRPANGRSNGTRPQMCKFLSQILDKNIIK